MDADVLAALPPEDAIFPSQSSFSSKRSSRSRTSSLNPQWYNTHYTAPRDANSTSPAVAFPGSSAERDSSQHLYSPSEEHPAAASRQQSATPFDPSSASHRPSTVTNILAPTPRRHLIETHESQHWLNFEHGLSAEASPPSPISPTGSILSLHGGYGGGGDYSRGVSPVTPTYRRSSSSSTALGGRRASSKASVTSGHQRTFSSLYQQDAATASATAGGKTLRRRQVSNTSLASTAAGTVSSSYIGLHKTALLRSRHGHGQQHQHAAEEAAAGRRWIRWMHKAGMREYVIPVAVGFATVLKLCMGMGSYSGESTPPMFGDYEAQRHWMELTIHLPFREWYTYDLQYWGLDYPPLTAYVSWLCGIIGHILNPTWFALDASRGIETPGSKLYMRLTVVVLDLLVYIPALVLFVRTWQGTRSKRTQEQAFLTLLLQPALLLVDHGHFQYNSVMLGFTLLAVGFFAQNRDILGALCFVASLGFKQMALYYAPAIGSYLLAKCIWLGWKQGTQLFVRLGLTTSISFALLFSPFFLPPFAPSFSHILHPITRIFPFNRGLFEDKVANFWCASNVVVKWKRLAVAAANANEDKARGWLVNLSTLLTAVGFSPSVMGLLRAAFIARTEATSKPTSIPPSSSTATTTTTTIGKEDRRAEAPVFLSLLPYALLTGSMSFFLFSFQVHEKTILLPLLPLTLLMSAASPGSTVFYWGALGNNVAVFSMWPLLKRDGQGLASLFTLLMWNRTIGYNPLQWVQFKSVSVKENTKSPLGALWNLSFVQFVSLAVYAAAIGLLFLEAVVPIPKRYPDLFPVLNVLVSTPVFVLSWLWSIKCGLEVGWALGAWRSSSGASKTSSVSASSGVESKTATNGVGKGHHARGSVDLPVGMVKQESDGV